MFADAVGNFNWKDWATFAGTSAACYPFGWAVGQCDLTLVVIRADSVSASLV